MRDNSWTHGQRRCPLHEALVEMGFKNIMVSASWANIDGGSYNIDESVWNSQIAEDAIEKINNGGEFSVELDLLPRDAITVL